METMKSMTHELIVTVFRFRKQFVGIAFASEVCFYCDLLLSRKFFSVDTQIFSNSANRVCSSWCTDQALNRFDILIATSLCTVYDFLESVNLRGLNRMPYVIVCGNLQIIQFLTEFIWIAQ